MVFRNNIRTMAHLHSCTSDVWIWVKENAWSDSLMAMQPFANWQVRTRKIFQAIFTFSSIKKYISIKSLLQASTASQIYPSKNPTHGMHGVYQNTSHTNIILSSNIPSLNLFVLVCRHARSGTWIGWVRTYGGQWCWEPWGLEHGWVRISEKATVYIQNYIAILMPKSGEYQKPDVSVYMPWALNGLVRASSTRRSCGIFWLMIVLFLVKKRCPPSPVRKENIHLDKTHVLV